MSTLVNARYSAKGTVSSATAKARLLVGRGTPVLRASLANARLLKTGIPRPLAISTRGQLRLRALPARPGRQRYFRLEKGASLQPYYARLRDQRLTRLSAPLTFYARERTQVYKSDPYFGGYGTISNYVYKQGSPAANRVVCLYDRATKTLIRLATTDSLGRYTFVNLANRPEGYFVVAFDVAGETIKKAGVSDSVFPYF